MNAGLVVAALNRMIDARNGGRTIFYDLYTAEEETPGTITAEDGLFFFRGKPGAPFAVIAPGGGFAYVGSVHEGFPYAAEISKQGYNAFVLKYRAGRGGAAAPEDLEAALAYIFENAGALGFSTARYSLWGSSAEARWRRRSARTELRASALRFKSLFELWQWRPPCALRTAGARS